MSSEDCELMRKTTAGKIVIGLVNVAFIAILATAVISAFPPAYGFSPGTMIVTPISPSVTRVSMNYTVTNNGFYAIDNFYVGVTFLGPGGEHVGSNQTVPVTIQKGTSPTGTITVDLNQTLINLLPHPSTYSITVYLHSEFAFRLLKLTFDYSTTQSM